MSATLAQQNNKSNSDVNPVIGIDLGSRNVKICLMNEKGIDDTRVIETVSFYRDYGHLTDNGFIIDIDVLGIPADCHLIATGYGRMSAALVGASNISELSAHAAGAKFQTGLDTFTLLDMGGQDYKVIRIENGYMTDIATNDKCAASTGRYLENMARTLGMSVSEIGGYSDDPVALTSTCAIFGESELIGLMVRGVPVERLAAGVNASVVERVVPLLERMGGSEIVMSGGVALNRAVVANVAAQTGLPVRVVDDPLLNGAIGCCIGAG